MTEATFEYSIDDKVTTIFGKKGIINMLAIDDGNNNIVFVKTATESQWLKEHQVTKGWRSTIRKGPRSE